MATYGNHCRGLLQSLPPRHLPPRSINTLIQNGRIYTCSGLTSGQCIAMFPRDVNSLKGMISDCRFTFRIICTSFNHSKKMLSGPVFRSLHPWFRGGLIIIHVPLWWWKTTLQSNIQCVFVDMAEGFEVAGIVGVGRGELLTNGRRALGSVREQNHRGAEGSIREHKGAQGSTGEQNHRGTLYWVHGTAGKHCTRCRRNHRGAKEQGSTVLGA